MPVIYPDNVQRGDRLQQLIDDLANIQTQVSNQSDSMDKANAAMRSSLDDLLKANNMTTYDQLVAKIKAEMTPDMQKDFQSIIDFNKQFGDVTDSILQVSGLVSGVAIVSKIGISITIFKQTVGMMRVVKGYAYGFKLLVTEGFNIAYEYFKGFRAALGAVTEEFTEATRFGKILGTAAEFCEFLGWAGVVIDGIMLIMQAIEGAAQKTKLIDGIHQTQVSRLSSEYFLNETIAMSAHIESLSDYMDMRASDDPDEQAASVFLGKTIAKRIASDVAKVTLDSVQATLSGQDSNRSHYSADDLSNAQVIALATVDVAPAATRSAAVKAISKSMADTTNALKSAQKVLHK